MGNLFDPADLRHQLLLLLLLLLPCLGCWRWDLHLILFVCERRIQILFFLNSGLISQSESVLFIKEKKEKTPGGMCLLYGNPGALLKHLLKVHFWGIYRLIHHMYLHSLFIHAPCCPPAASLSELLLFILISALLHCPHSAHGRRLSSHLLLFSLS